MANLTQEQLKKQALLAKIESLRQEVGAKRFEVLRSAILDRQRIDLLVTRVMGCQLAPHHAKMLRHQLTYPQSLALVWRGAGKSTVRTTAIAIYLLLKNPNERILICSKTGTNAVEMLREIRQHFESDNFKAVFGDLRGKIWTDNRISLKTANSPEKEVGITAVGVDGSLVSRHFTVGIFDDLVDEDNCRTEYMREKIKTFYYKQAYPTLLPGARIWIHGTRYHPKDFYQHLIDHDMSGPRHLVIPLMYTDENGKEATNWPSVYSLEWARSTRENQGEVIFETQYQCRADLMGGGEIFDYDNLVRMKVSEVNDEGIDLDALPKYIGVDLAVSESDKSDSTAAVVVAYHAKTDRFFVLATFVGKMRLSQQQELVVQLDKAFKPGRITIESVAYQGAMVADLKARNPSLPVHGFKPITDKITRMQRLSPLTEQKKIVFMMDYPSSLPHCSQGNNALISQLVAFPNDAHDDCCDAFDYAILASRRKSKVSKTGGIKIGLIGL